MNEFLLLMRSVALPRLPYTKDTAAHHVISSSSYRVGPGHSTVSPPVLLSNLRIGWGESQPHALPYDTLRVSCTGPILINRTHTRNSGRCTVAVTSRMLRVELSFPSRSEDQVRARSQGGNSALKSACIPHSNAPCYFPWESTA